MKVMYVDGILFPAFVTNMAKLIFHLDDPCVDIRQYIYIYIYIYYFVVNLKRYTSIDQYPKYIVPLAKPVQPPVRY